MPDVAIVDVGELSNGDSIIDIRANETQETRRDNGKLIKDSSTHQTYQSFHTKQQGQHQQLLLGMNTSTGRIAERDYGSFNKTTTIKYW